MRRLLAGAALVFVGLAGAGCSTSRMAVGAMTPVLENTVESALRSDDPRLVGDALPTSILLLEGMLETDPGNRNVARLSAMLHFSYAYAWVEEPDRASRLYARGAELGWEALDRPDVESAVRDGTLAEVAQALPRVREKDVPALLWVAANWAQWIQLNLGETRAVADVSRVMPLTARLVELDEAYFWGMPRILAGALQAARPVTLGGDPVRSAAEFARAFEISDRNMLLAQVFHAQTLCVQTFDADAFESSLREVLDAEPGRLPDAELLNQIARLKAEALLEQYEEIFE